MIRLQVRHVLLVTPPIWVFNQLTKPRYRPVTNIVAILLIAVTTIPILLAHRLTQEKGRRTAPENKTGEDDQDNGVGT